MTQFSRGAYDGLLERYDQHVQAVQEKIEAGQLTDEQGRQEINKFADVPLRSNGKKFNANSAKVLQALYGNWLEQTVGPKTPNFSGNLSGRTKAATIDVWAARTARRLLYDGKSYNPETGRLGTAATRWRIQPAAETGVEFSRKIGIEPGGDFGFAQEAFGKAAEKLGMEPDDLQALLWFHEKHLWDQNGWTKAAGRVKSSFESEASKLDTERVQAGITTYRDEASHDPVAMDYTIQDTRQLMAQMPGLVYGRVGRSEGLYGGSSEPTMDVEGTVRRGTDLTPIVHQVPKIARDNDQTDAFISRVVDADHPNARPGYEIGFKEPTTWDAVRQLTKDLAASSFDGFTVAVDRRGRPIGLRSQLIPEISARYAADPVQFLTVENAQAQSVIWADAARAALDSLSPSTRQLFSHETRTHYSTQVWGRGEYDAALQQADPFQEDEPLSAGLGRRANLLRGRQAE